MINLHSNRTSLQSLATIISQNLLSISQHLSTHHDFFASIAVYPLPEFPGRAEENLLGQLLRKKLEPNVEDWVDQGRRIANEVRERKQNGLNEEGLGELWDWAGRAANEEARRREWGDDFTLEEREMGTENVLTGLRRKLDQDDEESDEDEKGPSDEMDIDRKPDQAADGHKPSHAYRPPLPLDDILRFMSTGAEPKNMGDNLLG